VLLSVLATVLVISGTTIAAAQKSVGDGQTVTPQTAPNPGDPAVRNPQSATSSNQGDPGSEALKRGGSIDKPSRSEALNPSIGGAALGLGRQPPVTVGQAPADQQVVSPNAQPDDASPIPPKAAEPEEEENTRGADQANRVSNTGRDVPETPTGLVDLEGADPRSDRNFSFDTEKDPDAVSDTKN
jgi:hypothetical protein